jgi:hypothetical protein
MNHSYLFAYLLTGSESFLICTKETAMYALFHFIGDGVEEQKTTSVIFHYMYWG